MSSEFKAPRAHGSLSAWDDYPIHQVAETIRHAQTSDRNFYDRYYFNCHANDGNAFLIFGMGQYPNLGVQDSFAAVVTGTDHRVIRASRVLGDRMENQVGPLRVEVIRPLHELRVVCEPNEHEVAFDLTWTGSIPAYEEPRQFLRSHGRVVFDTMRLAQTGCWRGTITSGEHSFEVTPEKWWGTRDRSWGVRPVGEAEPPGIRTEGPMTGFWNYAPMQFNDHSILYMVDELDDGSRLLEEATRIWSDPERAPEPLGRPEHDAVVTPGTRRIESSVLRFPQAPGGAFEISMAPLLDCWVMHGTGYGLEDDWRHGMYQGDLVVQGRRIDYEEMSDQLFGLVDQVARFEQSNGAVGYGLHEFFFIGGFERYGMTDWEPAN